MSSFVITILENFLGDCKKDNEYKSQAQFNCPMCDDGKDKGNLEINYEIGKFKCWSCKEINGMYGNLSKLVKNHGSKEDYKKYLLLRPLSEAREIPIKDRVLEVPYDLKKLAEVEDDFKSEKIKNYLNTRGVTTDIIKRYDISFTNVGKYNNRVIIPSYDVDGNIEYFVTRSYQPWVKPKYLNPDIDKNTIIFFESKINWDSTIYLVEGVFDAIVLPNAIPLLGKFISDKLFMKLQEKAKADIVILLDGDAHDDAKQLYLKLNILNLYNKVKIIYLNNNLDVSLINEKFGKMGVKMILKSYRQLKESLL